MEQKNYTTQITTEFIRLQDLLKFEGLCETGGMAKARIQDGEVLVNGGSVAPCGARSSAAATAHHDGVTVTIE